MLGYSKSRKFQLVSNALQHFDVLGICISIYAHAITRCVCYHTYRRGLGVACSDTKGNARASNSGTAIVQSRFFVCLLLSMSNFSFRGQGILRTSRYGEKLLVDLVANCKRTNKNQSVSCPHSEKTLPLQSKENDITKH